MLNYTDSDVKIIVEEVLNEKAEIKPIGNHHLKRHLVYKVSDENGQKCVFKLYYKKNRWNREVASLKLFEGSDIKAPKIINFGKLQDGTEWLLMEFIDGEVLDKVK